MLRNRTNCCGNLLSRFAVSCGYRGMREMIVGVKCKLTDVEIACHSYVHCVSHCRFRVSKPNKKRNPIFKKLPCLFISLLSRLGPWDTKSVLQLSAPNKLCVCCQEPIARRVTQRRQKKMKHTYELIEAIISKEARVQNKEKGEINRSLILESFSRVFLFLCFPDKLSRVIKILCSS